MEASRGTSIYSAGPGFEGEAYEGQMRMRRKGFISQGSVADNKIYSSQFKRKKINLGN